MAEQGATSLRILRRRGSGRRMDLRDECGSALIEMAAAVPVFLLLLFGFTGFCMYTMDLCNMTYATRAAIRYACVHGAGSPNPATLTDMTAFTRPLLYKYPPNSGFITIAYPAAGDVACADATGGLDYPGYTVELCLTLNVHVSAMGFTSTAFTLNTATQGVVVH